MYTVKIQNKKNETLQLYPSEDYMLIGMTGITPSDGIISVAEMAMQDGARFNNAHVQTRNLIVNFDIRGEGEDVRKRRINLYKYIKTKEPVRVYIANDQRSVYIDGYVERLDDAGTIFSDRERMQLSVICPDPFFRDNAQDVTVYFGATSSEFHFPFAITTPIPFSTRSWSHVKEIFNAGDVECGVVFTLQASNTVVDPKISNEETNELMEFDITMEAGDELIISTRRGEKKVTFRSGGVETNALNTLKEGSDWLTLTPGNNAIYYTAFRNYDKIAMSCTYTILYEGI